MSASSGEKFNKKSKRNQTASFSTTEKSNMEAERSNSRLPNANRKTTMQQSGLNRKNSSKCVFPIFNLDENKKQRPTSLLFQSKQKNKSRKQNLCATLNELKFNKSENYSPKSPEEVREELILKLQRTVTGRGMMIPSLKNSPDLDISEVDSGFCPPVESPIKHTEFNPDIEDYSLPITVLKSLA